MDTYTSPALFVQIRDVALSGLMFVLFNPGSGRWRVDRALAPEKGSGDWNALGLLMRLSLGAPLLVGGFFAGGDSIQGFNAFAPLLVLTGIMLVSGIGVRPAAALIAAIMLWYAFSKLSVDKSLIANLNGIKREFALFAASVVLLRFAGGDLFIWWKPSSRTER